MPINDCVRELNFESIDVRRIAACGHDPTNPLALASRQGLWLAHPLSECESQADLLPDRCGIKDAAGRWPDFACLSWCPHQSRQGLIAASAQRTVWLWDSTHAVVHRRIDSGGDGTAHRAITDVDWSSSTLVTAARDGTVTLHDIRDLRSSNTVLNCKVQGFTQVRSSRAKSELVATGNGGSIMLWDLRSPGRPFQTVICHVSNRLGQFDWHSSNCDEIATCSPTEGEVKLWHINSLPEPRTLIPSGSSGVVMVRYEEGEDRLLIVGIDGHIGISSTREPLTTLATIDAPSDGAKIDCRVDWMNVPAPLLAAHPDRTCKLVVTAAQGSQCMLRCWTVVPLATQRSSCLPAGATARPVLSSHFA